MVQKFVNVDETRLSYLDNEADSNHVIFFIHGNSGSSRYWYKQYQSRQLEDYRLIAFDLPAHGQSSASENPEDYSLIKLGEVMAQAIREVAPQNASYVLVGLSLGTNVIAEMLAHKWILPKGVALVSSCVTGGEYTIDKIFKTDVDMSFMFTDGAPAQLVEAGYNAIVADPVERQLCIDDYHHVKVSFRSGLAGSIAQGKLRDEVLLIHQFSGSVLLVFGKDERAVNPDYLDQADIPLWRNEIIKLTGNHFVNMDSPDEFNKVLLEYCRDVLQ